MDAPRPGLDAVSKDLPAPQLLEDVLKNIPHSPILLKQMLGMFSSGSSDPTRCDDVAQSPDITGDPVHDSCDLTLTKLYPSVKNSVAQAVSGPDSTQLNFGTAFLACDEKCFFVTNDHVAGNATMVGIVSPDGKMVEYGNIAARNTDLDLVLIEPPADSNQRSAVKFGDVPKVGDPLFTVGHPLASPWEVISTGKVTALGATLDVKDRETGKVQHYSDLIKSGVQVFPGNSGGPEFNKAGEAVGVKVVASSFGSSVSIPMQKVFDMIRKAEGK